MCQLQLSTGCPTLTLPLRLPLRILPLPHHSQVRESRVESEHGWRNHPDGSVRAEHSRQLLH